MGRGDPSTGSDNGLARGSVEAGMLLYTLSNDTIAILFLVAIIGIALYFALADG